MSLFDSVYFPYGATSAPYSVAHPHRGNDYAAPEGTPIVLAGTQIGLVGQTGLADGPHCHVQAGHDEWAQADINPLPYTDKPGTVVKVGTASEWGNYVCIRVGDVYVYYCHMQRTDASVGQVISKGDDMFNEGDRVNMNLALYGTDKGRFKGAVDKSFKDAIYGIISSTEYKEDALINKGDVDNINGVFGKDSESVLGQTWKAFFYGYVRDNFPAPDTTGEAAKQIKAIKDVLGV